MQIAGLAAVTSPTAHVYDVVADALLESGASCIFGVLGEDTAPLVAAASTRGIAFHAARHENQAVAMADGFARSSGRTGIATVTGGAGFSNALTAIHTAHRAGSRVVVITGTSRPSEDDHEQHIIRSIGPAAWLKYFPHTSALALLGIASIAPRTAASAAADTHAALARGRNGTVVLVLGRNLVLESAETAQKRGFDAARAQAAPNAPDPHAVAAVADLLQETWAVSRPLILAGRGAAVSAAGPALQRLADLTGALLSTTLAAPGLFHGDPYAIGVCGSYATPVASELITQADCVLAFGAGLNPLTTFSNTLFPNALVVQVDHDECALGRFMDVQISIRGDARLVAEALVGELERRGHQATGFRTAETRAAIAAYRPDAELCDRSTMDRLDPRRLMLALDSVLPPERIVCSDGGQHSRFAIRYVRVTRPENFMLTVDAGSIGLALGAGIGAAIARPRDLVVVFVGDGSMMMALGDLDTAVRLRVPMLIVVSNDDALGAEVNVLSDLGMSPTVAEIASPSFKAIAVAMGARAATVRSLADLRVVEQWLEDRIDMPLVLDCHVNTAVRAR